MGASVPVLAIARVIGRSVAIDLKNPAANLQWVERADVLVEGFRRGTIRESLGLGPRACAAVQPAPCLRAVMGWGPCGTGRRRYLPMPFRRRLNPEVRSRFGAYDPHARKAARAIRRSWSPMSLRLNLALCGVELIRPNTACAADLACASSAPTTALMVCTHSST